MQPPTNITSSSLQDKNKDKKYPIKNKLINESSKTSQKYSTNSPYHSNLSPETLNQTFEKQNSSKFKNQAILSFTSQNNTNLLDKSGKYLSQNHLIENTYEDAQNNDIFIGNNRNTTPIKLPLNQQKNINKNTEKTFNYSNDTLSMFLATANHDIHGKLVLPIIRNLYQENMSYFNLEIPNNVLSGKEYIAFDSTIYRDENKKPYLNAFVQKTINIEQRVYLDDYNTKYALDQRIPNSKRDKNGKLIVKIAKPQNSDTNDEISWKEVEEEINEPVIATKDFVSLNPIIYYKGNKCFIKVFRQRMNIKTHQIENFESEEEIPEIPIMKETDLNIQESDVWKISGHVFRIINQSNILRLQELSKIKPEDNIMEKNKPIISSIQETSRINTENNIMNQNRSVISSIQELSRIKPENNIIEKKDSVLSSIQEISKINTDNKKYVRKISVIRRKKNSSMEFTEEENVPDYAIGNSDFLAVDPTVYKRKDGTSYFKAIKKRRNIKTNKNENYECEETINENDLSEAPPFNIDSLPRPKSQIPLIKIAKPIKNLSGETEMINVEKEVHFQALNGPDFICPTQEVYRDQNGKLYTNVYRMRRNAKLMRFENYERTEFIEDSDPNVSNRKVIRERYDALNRPEEFLIEDEEQNSKLPKIFFPCFRKRWNPYSARYEFYECKCEVSKNQRDQNGKYYIKVIDNKSNIIKKELTENNYDEIRNMNIRFIKKHEIVIHIRINGNKLEAYNKNEIIYEPEFSNDNKQKILDKKLDVTKIIYDKNSFKPIEVYDQIAVYKPNKLPKIVENPMLRNSKDKILKTKVRSKSVEPKSKSKEIRSSSVVSRNSNKANNKLEFKLVVPNKDSMNSNKQKINDEFESPVHRSISVEPKRNIIAKSSATHRSASIDFKPKSILKKPTNNEKPKELKIVRINVDENSNEKYHDKNDKHEKIKVKKIVRKKIKVNNESLKPSMSTGDIQPIKSSPKQAPPPPLLLPFSGIAYKVSEPEKIAESPDDLLKQLSADVGEMGGKTRSAINIRSPTVDKPPKLHVKGSLRFEGIKDMKSFGSNLSSSQPVFSLPALEGSETILLAPETSNYDEHSQNNQEINLHRNDINENKFTSSETENNLQGNDITTVSNDSKIGSVENPKFVIDNNSSKDKREENPKVSLIKAQDSDNIKIDISDDDFSHSTASDDDVFMIHFNGQSDDENFVPFRNEMTTSDEDDDYIIPTRRNIPKKLIPNDDNNITEIKQKESTAIKNIENDQNENEGTISINTSKKDTEEKIINNEKEKAKQFSFDEAFYYDAPVMFNSEFVVHNDSNYYISSTNDSDEYYYSESNEEESS